MPGPLGLCAVTAIIPPQYQLEPQAPPFEKVMERWLRQTGAVMEKREVSLDLMVKEATSGRRFSNAELLALQATMHRYSIELELLSKLVQTAVQGLKDLLHTQV